ncbi:MAG: PorT family protein [Ignavibacteriaceae bacterium]|nr:PorT family protein [Ignavibacteriaceae bacterium]
MKNGVLFIIVFTFILFTGHSYAQLELKPAIGLNFTNFSEDPTTGKTSAKVGWQLGGTISMGDKFYGEGGIFWTYKSTEFTEDATDNEFSTQLSGIRIPVIVGFHLLSKESSLVGLRAFGGASVFIITTVNALDLTKDDFNTASWGVFLGAGIDISMFFVDLSYEWSLTDVSSVASFDVGKSKSLFINAGIRLSL